MWQPADGSDPIPASAWDDAPPEGAEAPPPPAPVDDAAATDEAPAEADAD